ncbi:hypothetical protein HYH03_004352 [Edaphochlamys debaryana]|uniref:Uncharacterized protein n=1 Tax=Edaphochlamys debaryana TaxID=47281 RepID=A0A836C3A5_9CHLO|nr:hypothetical protein HYH03_004352 [Edaphochlamys debaryana]|eukprot:KAG2497608.1 hypothetical protein HYH03_004352 [Edaphochlamys debaryana]
MRSPAEQWSKSAGPAPSDSLVLLRAYTQAVGPNCGDEGARRRAYTAARAAQQAAAAGAAAGAAAEAGAARVDEAQDAPSDGAAGTAAAAAESSAASAAAVAGEVEMEGANARTWGPLSWDGRGLALPYGGSEGAAATAAAAAASLTNSLVLPRRAVSQCDNARAGGGRSSALGSVPRPCNSSSYAAGGGGDGLGGGGVRPSSGPCGPRPTWPDARNQGPGLLDNAFSRQSSHQAPCTSASGAAEPSSQGTAAAAGPIATIAAAAFPSGFGPGDGASLTLRPSSAPLVSWKGGQQRQPLSAAQLTALTRAGAAGGQRLGPSQALLLNGVGLGPGPMVLGPGPMDLGPGPMDLGPGPGNAGGEETTRWGSAEGVQALYRAAGGGATGGEPPSGPAPTLAGGGGRAGGSGSDQQGGGLALRGSSWQLAGAGQMVAASLPPAWGQAQAHGCGGGGSASAQPFTNMRQLSSPEATWAAKDASAAAATSAPSPAPTAAAAAGGGVSGDGGGGHGGGGFAVRLASSVPRGLAAGGGPSSAPHGRLLIAAAADLLRAAGGPAQPAAERAPQSAAHESGWRMSTPPPPPPPLPNSGPAALGSGQPPLSVLRLAAAPPAAAGEPMWPALAPEAQSWGWRPDAFGATELPPAVPPASAAQAVPSGTATWLQSPALGSAGGGWLLAPAQLQPQPRAPGLAQRRWVSLAAPPPGQGYQGPPPPAPPPAPPPLPADRTQEDPPLFDELLDEMWC